ncbi:MAG: NUDIX domain-containing protein [Cyclobacteriaceae bacterium]
MEQGKSAFLEVFGNQLRVRVCGLCIVDGKILLVKHTSLGNKKYFWSPPGGGMDYGTDAADNLEREYLEETGLIVKTGDFVCVHEFLAPPLHAIELFYQVHILGGNLVTGTDPELHQEKQLIKDVQFVPFAAIKDDEENAYHNIFKCSAKPDEILTLKGYFLFDDRIK